MKYLFLENGLVQKLPFTTLKGIQDTLLLFTFHLLHQEVIDENIFIGPKI